MIETKGRRRMLQILRDVGVPLTTAGLLSQSVVCTNCKTAVSEMFVHQHPTDGRSARTPTNHRCIICTTTTSPQKPKLAASFRHRRGAQQQNLSPTLISTSNSKPQQAHLINALTRRLSEERPTRQADPPSTTTHIAKIRRTLSIEKKDEHGMIATSRSSHTRLPTNHPRGEQQSPATTDEDDDTSINTNQTQHQPKSRPRKRHKAHRQPPQSGKRRQDSTSDSSENNDA